MLLGSSENPRLPWEQAPREILTTPSEASLNVRKASVTLRDLRMVITSMKIAAHLERISDQAVSIAKRARKVIKNPEIKDTLKVEGLYKVSSAMLSSAMTAYADSNSELALTIIEGEKALKKCHKTTSRVFARTLEGETDQYRDYLDLVFICRWLERVGDLAMNIAEEVVFEDTSADIRHGGELPPELQ